MDLRHSEEIPFRGMLIGGELVEASDGGTMASQNPTTEDIVGNLPVATSDDVNRAVAEARSASREWRELSWERRAAYLRTYAEVLESNVEELAHLDAVDAGLPVKSMRADVRSAADEIRYFAGIASEAKGDAFPAGPNNLTLTEFVPYSVVARIVPFNHPVKFAAAKSSAALAAGATVLVKPGEMTSLSALRLGELVKDVFPPGVFNVITGPGGTTGAALSEHPDVPRVAFTGSVATGVHIAQAGAPYVKHVTLELGGKNPMIVFPDANPAEAAVAAVGAMNFARSMGQSCGSSSRLFVHADIYDEVVATLVDTLAALRVGDPLESDTDMGPLAFKAHYDKVLSMVEAGRAGGATLLYGGGRPEGLDMGFFIEPTVFGEVDMSMRIAREEIFGPVLCVLRWSDCDQMIEDVNSLDLGLTGNVWTNDIDLAVRTARRIESGYITVNGSGKRPSGSPFGGFKRSGIGKEGSIEELLSYGRQRAINVNLR